LNTLKKGQIFGIASLFGEKCGTTEVVAKESCSYAVLSEENVEHLLKNDIFFTKNYISILSEKIRFLNKKISFFTSGSAERKLANYILSQHWENNTLKLGVSLSRLASILDIGRASLYRALDLFEENGLITRENNVIKITSPEEFKKIYGGSL
ncbi:MAG: Crp/Fnr family transcriptional regulator, partial [Clostridia bacterium]|nr:Crp/Fnr family transcriptional regulator [Clostridia bacterium]